MKENLFKSNFRRIILLFILTISLSQVIVAQEKTYGYVKIGGGGYVCSVIESLTEENVFYAKSDVGGIYRWNETTQDWTPLFAWVSPDETTYMGTEAFVIDPSSPNRLFSMAGTSYWNGGKSALLRSFDYGKTWEIYETTAKFKVHGNGSDRQKGETLAIDPANGNVLYFGTRNSNGLFKSIDAGKTWNKVTTFPDSIGTAASFSFVLFDKDSATPDGCSTIIVGNHKTGNNLFISEDFGATWTSIGGFNKAKPQRCVLSPNDRNLYVTYANGAAADGSGGVYKYNLTTKQWTNISPATNRGYSGISLILNDPQKITCSTYSFWSKQPWDYGDEIYYSGTGGTAGSWVRKNSSTGCTMVTNGIDWMKNHSMHWVGCVTMSNTKPGVVYAVSGNGVFMTDNIMATKPTWKVVSHGLEETVPCFQGMLSIPNGPLITSIGDVNGFVHTDINQYPTANITQSASMAYAPQNTATIVRSVNKQRELSPGQYEYWNVVALSENNGSTWTELPQLPVKISNAKTSISADGKIILWQANSAATGNVLYWTDNKGVTWNKTATMPANAVPVPDGVDPLKFYLYNTTGKIYRSDDGAKTFNPISNVGSAGGSSVLKTIPGKAGHVWINNNGKVRYSTNEGVTFTTCSNYSCAAFTLGKEAPGKDYPTVYIWGKAAGALPEAMYRSVDMGKTWIRANDDDHEWGHLANAGNIEADQNVYGRVYKSTAGMGIPWMGINTGDGVSMNYAEKNSIIGPNPFVNSITLRANGVNIKSIDIYNISGMQIQHIETDMYANETIDFGEDLAKGAYLINVRDTKNSQQYKIIKQ